MADRWIAGCLLETLLGQTPQAQRWRARDVDGRPVELTLLSEARSAQPEVRARFLAEATAVAAVRSRALVPVEVREHDGRPVVVSRPPAAHQDLPTALSAFGSLGFDAASSVLVQVAGGLQAMAQRGLVHGRVRPSGVLFDVVGGKAAVLGGHPVLDGLLSWEPDGRSADEEAFLAPEQRAGRPATTAADVWALVQVFVTCLRGEPAPAAPAERDVVLEACLSEVHRPAFRRALDPDPARRTPTPDAFLQEVFAAQRAARGEPDPEEQPEPEAVRPPVPVPPPVAVPPPVPPADVHDTVQLPPHPPAPAPARAGRWRVPAFLAACALLGGGAALWLDSRPVGRPPAQQTAGAAGQQAPPAVWEGPVEALRQGLVAQLPEGVATGCEPLPERERGEQVAAVRCTALPLDGQDGADELLLVRWRTPEAMAQDWDRSYRSGRYTAGPCQGYAPSEPGEGHVSRWTSADGTSVVDAPLACYVNRADPPASVVLWEHPEEALQVVAVRRQVDLPGLYAWSRAARAR